MSIKRRGKVWWIDFTTPNGQRIRQSAGTEDKEKAQEYHDREKARWWDHQRLGVRLDRTWEDATVKWVKEKEHKRSIEDDKAKLVWLYQFLGQLRLSQVTRDLVERIGERKAEETSKPNANRYL